MYWMKIDEVTRHGRRELSARCECGWRRFATDVSIVRFADECVQHTHMARPPAEGGRRCER